MTNTQQQSHFPVLNSSSFLLTQVVTGASRCHGDAAK